MYNYSLESIRGQEFSNIRDVVYVDNAGTTLFSKSQMDAVYKDLTSNLYGNPHSHNHSSKLSTDSIDQMRYRLLRFFNASPDEYSLIFTSGCTASLKLVASSFNFEQEESRGVFCCLQDNHTSVQGIRGQVAEAGVSAVCLDEEEFQSVLTKSSQAQWNEDVSNSPSPASLFAFPAQSNFSGRRYPLAWIKQIQESGLDLSQIRQNASKSSSCPSSWYVLLDAASYCSTSPLHLGHDGIKPDFVTLSFYKIFGYPTGLGALLVHKRAAHLLSKKYYGGGAVAASTAKEPFEAFRKQLHDRFEDGTLPFLDIICLRHGLDAVHRLAGGMDAISKHVFCVARFFYQHLTSLKHGNGQPLAEVYGGAQFLQPEDQGGIVTFNLQRSDGSFIGYAEVDKFAQLHDIHLRTGCFCNIGACQEYLHLSSKMIEDNFSAGHECGDNMDLINGHPTGAVRISFGYMSTLDDAKACLRFITDSFLEEVSPIPSFSYPEWYEKEKAESIRSISMAAAAGKRDLKTGNGIKDTATVPGVDMPGQLKESKSVSDPSKEVVPSSPTSQLAGPSHPRTDNSSSGPRRVTDIFLYPIKSCGVFRVSEWEMGAKGFLYDREWVLVSDTGVTLGQRREPKMCLITPHIDLTSRKIVLNFPGEFPFELSLDQEEEAIAMANLCNNKVCGDRVNTYDCGDGVADWLSNVLLRPGIRMLRQLSQDTRTSKQKDKGTEMAPADQRLSLANESQMLLLNRASIRALQEKMVELGGLKEDEDSKIPTAPQDISEQNMLLRFRGNLVVDGCAPFEEEEWTSFTVGDNTVVCQGICSRCSMICMDQVAGTRSREPLRSLSLWKGKKVPFGVHSRMLPPCDNKPQFIRVGDLVHLLDGGEAEV